jgi:Sec7-like guanine-nucleotide exchange factor
MSDPHSPRQGSSTSNFHPHTPGLASHTNSLSLSRDAISLPDREEGETAIQYLSRVEDIAARSQIPSILSKDRDEFFHAVMRSFMRKFAYFGDPLDMAIRKLLMEIDLPKETQQIDRVLQSFSDRYHECNPGIFPTAGK